MLTNWHLIEQILFTLITLRETENALILLSEENKTKNTGYSQDVK